VGRLAHAVALAPLVWREWRHHPWRHAVALLAVSLGVALAGSVHLINRSALGEFAAAVRSANGDPDLSLRGQREGFDDGLFARVLDDEAVRHASAVVELETYARAGPGGTALSRCVCSASMRCVSPRSRRRSLPLPARGEPAQVFLDDGVRVRQRARRASAWLGAAEADASATACRRCRPAPPGMTLRVAGQRAQRGGTPLVSDGHRRRRRRCFGLDGRAHAHRPAPRARHRHRRRSLARLALPAGVQSAVAADEAEQRVSNLSRAYRVNLTVLALVALFVGAFLVFSVVSLSVAQRTPTFALLGVLGLTAGEPARAWCSPSARCSGLAGSLLGLAARLRAWRWRRCACWRATSAAATSPASRRRCR
jgi:putative ABC transport system permease protein